MYVAIELITKQDDAFVINTFKKETRDDAESAYHSILASAAKSQHKIHAALILNQAGTKIKSEYYTHKEPEPVGIPEEEEEEEEIEPETPAEGPEQAEE